MARKARQFTDSLCCLHIQSTAVVLSIGKWVDSNDQVELQALDFIAFEDQSKLADAIAELANRHELKHLPTQVVLSPYYYRLIQLDQPKVPEDELATAVKWLVKDLIDFPLKEAAVDAFSIPIQPGRAPKCYAAVAQISVLNNLRTACDRAKIDIIGIGITELAINDFFLKQNLDSFVVMLLQPDSYLVCAGHEGALCFLRQLSPHADIDALGLDIQRSLDYYQSQMLATSPDSIFCIGSGEDDKNLIQKLSAELTIPMCVVNYSGTFILPENVDQLQLNSCAISMAGLLMGRHDAES